LVELLAVLAALALLAAVLLPALARAGGSRQGASCLNNLQQMGRALQLYAADYANYLPPNVDNGSSAPYSSWVCGEAGRGGVDEFNPDILKDPTRSLLVSYLNGDASVFHCPSDLRTGRYQGTDPALTNTIVPSARSYSMSEAVGTLPDSPGGKAAVYGPWLSGDHNEAPGAWFTFARTTDMVRPGPANTFVFLDEDPYSINDGSFGNVGPYPGHQVYKWMDWPATYHDYGANFAFGDGHAETHTWQDPRTQVQNGNVAQSTQPGNPDIVWLAEHTTALIRQTVLSGAGPDAAHSLKLSFPSLKGASYTAEYADSLSSTNWQTLGTVVSTNGEVLTVTDPAATNGQRLYRVWTP
jgi:prepilin-type processing-associated H-X9-DG protein